jgi:hypothetical protein
LPDIVLDYHDADASQTPCTSRGLL